MEATSMSKKKPLKSLTKKEHQKLKDMGFLWEFYPEATGIWSKDKNEEKDNDSSSFSLTNVEQSIGNASLPEERIERLDSQCSIHVHSKRKRLVDADGVSAKAAIDGLVHAGLLQDDSPKFVKEVSYSQEKIQKGEEEETIIEVYIYR